MKFSVDAPGAGQRLDQWLSARLAPRSRHQIQNRIKTGDVRVNGTVATVSRRLRAGDQIEIADRDDPAEPAPPVPQAMALKIVFEDDHLLVINKPAGLVTHPAPGNETGTLANALLDHCGSGVINVGGENRCGIVHRLDKDTSGLLLAAKTDSAHARLASDLAQREIRRIYAGIAIGSFDPSRGEIDKPVARRKSDRKLMGIVASGRPARTSYEMILALHGMTLALIRLHTGRTHQIRVHFQSIGHPILGDRVYGWTKSRILTSVDASVRSELGAIWPARQMLHAIGIRFRHPETGRWMTCQSAMPEDMAKVARLIFGERSPESVERRLKELLEEED
ncbi:RluA family pseudouridine synthase [Candidatus Sumerlaeota bacterium]|nr:RluA family pseudouridine synthase [Candidatus Sumerlaeota bacterium]